MVIHLISELMLLAKGPLYSTYCNRGSSSHFFGALPYTQHRSPASLSQRSWVTRGERLRYPKTYCSSWRFGEFRDYRPVADGRPVAPDTVSDESGALGMNGASLSPYHTVNIVIDLLSLISLSYFELSSMVVLQRRGDGGVGRRKLI